MLLSDLEKRGGFVSAEPVRKEVVWLHETEGEIVTDKFFIFVLKQSFGIVEKLWTGGDDRSRSATIISECIRLGDNAEQRMSYEQAYQLHPGLAAVFMRAFNEVNDSHVPKKSRPRRKSGTS